MDGQSVSPEPSRRVAVRIAYRGQDFHGSQRQPGTRTVEGEVIEALLRVQEGMSEKELELKAASRTDAGVSALGNVVSFRTRFRDDALLMDALNAVSRGVFFLAVAELPDGYGIRRALRRRYLYIHPAARLNVERMREAAAMMQGEHDFARFCRDDGKPTTLLMEEVDIQVRDGLIEMRFSAPYFLWNLVRRLVAAVIKVGRGHASLDEVRRALEGEEVLFGLARPDRLTLLDVEYDDLSFVYYHGVPLCRRLEEERLRASLSLEFYSRLLP
ncbi:MAG: tRNA pseudouridine(38-40) synthase TruA [Candidatus Methanomethylophilaceae archaeon]|jgi:tRNA pseudouridine38-40 synthase